MTTWKRSSRLDNHTTIQREDGTKLFRLAGATDQELALAVAAPKLLDVCRAMRLLLTNTAGFDQGATPAWMKARAEAVSKTDTAITAAESSS